MDLRDLLQALTASPITQDALTVELQRGAADLPSFEPGAPHASAHQLDDQVALELVKNQVSPSRHTTCASRVGASRRRQPTATGRMIARCEHEPQLRGDKKLGSGRL